MVNIKITYESTSRRLNISSTTSWSELETQFRSLFSIPKEVQMRVTYTDEEGDVITLSSDLELQEVLSNFSNNTIKFVLNTSNKSIIDRERSIDTIIDEETSNLIDGVSAIQIEDQNNNKASTSKYKHVSITENVSQETLGENSKNAARSTNNENLEDKNSSVERNQENYNDDDEPEIIVIIARNPWSHRRRGRFSGYNPYHSYHHLGRGFHHYRGEFQQGYHNGGCNRNASSRGRHRRRQQISPEVVAERLDTLHSMGFFDDNLEELVKKYNGKLELIIEVLLFNQRNGFVQNNEREENNEKHQQPMEIEEENRPYVHNN